MVSPIKRTVFLDTETTGLDDTDTIVEVAIIDARGEVLIDSLVDPQRPIPPEVTRRSHKITDKMVAGQPKLEDLWPEIRAAVEGCRVVIYNVDYDRKFFPDKLECAGELSCALRRFQRLPGTSGKGNSTLKAAAERAGHVWNGPQHRALADTLATRTVWSYLDYHAVQHTGSRPGPRASGPSTNKPNTRAMFLGASGIREACRDENLSDQEARVKVDELAGDLMRLIGSGGTRKPGTAAPTGEGRGARLGADDVPSATVASEPGGPFHGKRMIVTGELKQMTRDAAKQLIKNAGGTVVSVINKKTDIVVVGDNPGPKKLEKLEELKREGVDIEILDEDAFVRLLGQAVVTLSPKPIPE